MLCSGGIDACVRACVRAPGEGGKKRTEPYSLPLLFIATNSSLRTPYKLMTPRSTAEISNRPERARTCTHTRAHREKRERVRGELCQRPHCVGGGVGGASSPSRNAPARLHPSLLHYAATLSTTPPHPPAPSIHPPPSLPLSSIKVSFLLFLLSRGRSSAVYGGLSKSV